MISMQFKPNKKRKAGDLSDVEGSELLHLFHGFVSNLSPDSLVNRTREHYVKIEDVKASGRTVFVKTESGPFGEEGQTIDVTTHQVAHVRTAAQSATTMTRMLLVVPPKGQTAIFVIERQGGATGGIAVFDLFKRALLAKFSDHFFPDKTVVESDAWSAEAELRSVTAVAYRFPVNIADGLVAQAMPAGILRQTLEPSGAARFLPRALWDALRNKRIDASQFMGFENHDIDETVVELEREGQKKTYVLGKESQPSIRVQITADGERPLTDVDFSRRAALEAKSLYQGMGLTWEDRWLTGQWEADDLAVKLEMP